MARAFAERAKQDILKRLGLVASKSMFRDCVTIDPFEVEDTWERPDVDTRFVELAELPATLHTAFVSTLVDRQHEQGQ